MHSTDPHVEDKLKNYALRERKLQEEISKCENKRLRIEYERASKTISNESSTIIMISNDDARMRNSNLLKDLERTKARLRTTASFTPTDRELDERLKIYKSFTTNKIIEDPEKSS